jgi:hypothetical protein
MQYAECLKNRYNAVDELWNEAITIYSDVSQAPV